MKVKNNKSFVEDFLWKISLGFTLVELLIAIAIIGVLSASLIFILNPVEQFKKAHDAQRKNDFEQIRTALDTYYNDNNRYPDSLVQIASYMPTVPDDPLGVTYCYQSDEGNSFILSTNLERTSDPQVIPSGVLCQGEVYNYALTSSNTSTVAYAVPTPTPIPPTPTSTPTPTSIPTPTPTSTPTPTIAPTLAPGWTKTGDFDSYSEGLVDIAVDSNYIYIGGTQTVNAYGTYVWRVEKRNTSNGTPVSSFGSSGIIEAQGFDSLKLAIDSNYIYLAGQIHNCTGSGYGWRLEKRNINTGALVSNFGSGGSITSCGPSGGYLLPVDIVVDSNYIYIGIYDYYRTWKIEKRNISTGALVSNFGSGGTVTEDFGRYSATFQTSLGSIAIDSNYIFISGGWSNESGTELTSRIEKRDISTGALASNFGSGGILESNIVSAPYGFYHSIAIDSNYLYSAKNVESQYQNNRWQLEKRDINTGALSLSFGSGGMIFSIHSCSLKPSLSVNINIDSNYIYLSGTGGLPDGYGHCNGAIYRLEKRNINTGALVSNFGTGGIIYAGSAMGGLYGSATAIDSGYIYDGGTTCISPAYYGCLAGKVRWFYEKRNINTGNFTGIP